MAESNLEEIAQEEAALKQLQQRAAHREVEKESIDAKVDGFWSGVRNLAYLTTTIAAAAYLGGSLMALDAVSFAGGFMGGKVVQKIMNKETTSYTDVLKDGIVGGLMGMFVNVALGAFAPAAGLAKFLFFYPLNTVFMPMQFTLDHVIRKYDPVSFVGDLISNPVETMTHLYEDVVTKMEETYWMVTKYMVPLFGASAVLLPRTLLGPVFGILNVIYGAVTVGGAKNVTSIDSVRDQYGSKV